MDTKNSEDEDALYENLPNFKYDNTIDKLLATIAKLEADNSLLRGKLSEMDVKNKTLEKNCSILQSNISSLLKTAKLELRRKEKMIAELRQRSGRYDSPKVGLKRRFTSRPSPTKRARLSESHRQEELNRPAGPATSDRSDTVPVVPSVGSSPPVAELPAPEIDRTKTLVASTTAVNNIPAYKGPTLFSSRMFKKLHNVAKTATTTALTTVSKLELPPTSSEIVDSDAAASKTPSLVNKHANTSTTVPAEDKLNISKDVDSGNISSIGVVEKETVNLSLDVNDHVSNTFSKTEVPVNLQTESKSLDDGKIRNPVDVLIDSLRSKIVNIARMQLLVDTPSPPSCGLRSVNNSCVGTSDEPGLPVIDVNIDSKTNVAGELPNNRSSMVDSVRLTHDSNKPQTSIDGQENSSTAGKSKVDIHSGKPLLSCGKVEKTSKPLSMPSPTEILSPRPVGAHVTTSGSSTFKETKSVATENLPTVDIGVPKGKVDSHSKKSSFFKLKTCQKRMFSPIPNQRKLPMPLTTTEKVNCGEGSPPKNTEEDLCPNGVSATSELNVRIEETKAVNCKSLEESIFGSPVKWADESSDSIKETVNSRSKTIYGIFGSPLKCLDSPTEPTILLSQAAYEDSCTIQASEKQPSLPKSALAFAQQSPNVVSCQTGMLKSAIQNLDQLSRDALKVSSSPSGVKNASTFILQNDTRTSVLSGLHEDKSFLGSVGIFKQGAPYGDSLLGLFDDTAQFVSALAKVDTKISPLSTPVKSLDVSDELQSANKNIPISFEQAFQNRAIQEEAVCTTIQADQLVCTHNEATSNGFKAFFEEAASINSPTITPKTGGESLSVNVHIVSTVERPMPSVSSTFKPAATPSPKFIHRSNFSSSSVFSLNSNSQSNFADKPLNVLQPRKEPRLVSRVGLNHSPQKDVKDPKSNPRIAINDSFITEQEERVLHWKKNNLFETILLSSPRTSSPSRTLMKITSPSSRRHDSSPRAMKRAAKKPVSPSKIARHEERNQLRSELPKLIGSSGGNTKSPSGSTEVLAGNAVHSIERASKDEISAGSASLRVPRNSENSPTTEKTPIREDTHEKQRLEDPVARLSVSCLEGTSSDLLKTVDDSIASGPVATNFPSPATVKTVKQPNKSRNLVADAREVKPVIIKRQQRSSDFKRPSASRNDNMVKIDISRMCVPFVSRAEADRAKRPSKATTSRPLPSRKRNYRLENSCDNYSNTQQKFLGGSLLEKTQILESSLRCVPQIVVDGGKWILHPIDLTNTEATYDSITSRFSPFDPRSCPTRRNPNLSSCSEKPVVHEPKKIDVRSARPQSEVDSPNVSLIVGTPKLKSVVVRRTPQFATSTPCSINVSKDSRGSKSKTRRISPKSPKENIAGRREPRKSKTAKSSERVSTRQQSASPNEAPSRRRYCTSTKPIRTTAHFSHEVSSVASVIKSNPKDFGRRVSSSSLYAVETIKVVISPGKRKASFGASS